MMTALLAVAGVGLGTVASAQEPITYRYFYDASGQLIRTLDSSGISIEYVYDRAGNIIEVRRTTVPVSGALAIFSFAPAQAGPGSTVVIRGQGFSTTPSANAVFFNGTPASISSATTTALDVSVPTGATTGPISVVVGGQTVTSTNNFTVIAAPTILSVAPRFFVSSASAVTRNLQIAGANLVDATFEFTPAFTPKAITVTSATIDQA